MALEMNRREAIALGITSLAALSLPGRADNEAPSPLVQSHDEKVNGLLAAQVTDPQSRWCGAIPDEWGIHYCTAAAGLLRDGAAAYFHPESKFHGSQELFDRMKLAAGFLTRSQNDEGNIDLPSTNFNSPPDTGFVVHSVACAAKLAQMNKDETVLSLVKDFLLQAGQGLSQGGIHTPNHRWVVCAALAQIHDLFPNQQYVDRIDQWLAESIDIDDEGQYTERSTSGYNTVVDNALVVVAHKLNRPNLLEPVRKNLDAMAYLLHPNGEVVTEISFRQDLNTRGTMSGYWFVLQYMAIRDGNGMYAAMLKQLKPDCLELPRFMEYPELANTLPPETPVPTEYEREYPLSGITRIRRGKTSATFMHKGNSRWISLRRGEAVINAIRFSGAFFGKGQFIPTVYEKRADGYYFTQKLRGRYMQPISDPALLPVRPDTWPGLVVKRKETQICLMDYEGLVRETAKGFEISISAQGTSNAPFVVEINLREGGQLTGVTAAPNSNDVFLLKDGFAEYRIGADVIRFGPGKCEHAWVEVRGAQAKLAGPSVYLTGYTPFQQTLTFEMS